MRIVAFVPHFWPDTAPTGDVATQLVEQWAASGHHVDVVTTLPHYRDHAVTGAWRGRLVRRQTTEWGSVLRISPCLVGDKANVVGRAISFGAFGVLAAAASLGASTHAADDASGFGWRERAKPDVVLAMSPPLTLAPAAALLAKTTGAPLVLNLQDVHPDAAIASGVVSEGPAADALKVMERTSYALADAVVVVGAAMRQLVAERVRGSVRVIENFAPADAYEPTPRLNSYRRSLGVADDTLVFAYAGNVGYSQPLDLVVEAARRLRARNDIHFVINGGGNRFADVAAAAAALGNLTVRPFQPAETTNEVRAATDVHLVLLAAGLGNVSVPSKTYAAFAASRPVLAASDAASDLATLVGSSGAGRWIELSGDAERDVASFTAAVVALADDRDELAAMAARAAGRAQVGGASVAAASYAQLFTELVAES